MRLAAGERSALRLLADVGYLRPYNAMEWSDPAGERRVRAHSVGSLACVGLVTIRRSDSVWSGDQPQMEARLTEAGVALARESA